VVEGGLLREARPQFTYGAVRAAMASYFARTEEVICGPWQIAMVPGLRVLVSHVAHVVDLCRWLCLVVLPRRAPKSDLRTGRWVGTGAESVKVGRGDGVRWQLDF